MRDAANDSREPSGKLGGGEIEPLREPRRAAGLLNDVDNRGETAARAVAPLGIVEADALLAPDTAGGVRREAPVGGREAVVVDMNRAQLS